MDSLDRSGGDAHHPLMEQRVAALEADMKEVKSILSRLEPVIARMDERIAKQGEQMIRIDERTKDMPTAKEFGELKGRVAQLPTLWTILTMMAGTFAFAFAIVRWGIPHP